MQAASCETGSGGKKIYTYAGPCGMHLKEIDKGGSNKDKELFIKLMSGSRILHP